MVKTPQSLAGFAVLPIELPASDIGTVTTSDYHHDHVRVKCDLKEAGLLVLTDSWNPRWSVTVDGKNAYMGRVNVAFRGVAVPAGRHDVEFRYYPASRLIGQIISGVTLLGLVVGLWQWQRMLPEAALSRPGPTRGRC